MGQGVAIKPSSGKLYAPCDATVTVAFETGHAYGLKTSKGAELLIHIGIDTVSLGGRGFTSHVTVNQMVKAGDLLASFDLDTIASTGLDHTTMLVVTNTADYRAIKTLKEGDISVGQDLLALS